MTQDGAAADFAKRVIGHQPLAYARTVFGGLIRSFAPTRTHRPGEPPVGQWIFRRTYPVFYAGIPCSLEQQPTDGSTRSRLCRDREAVLSGVLEAHGQTRPRSQPRLASFLHAYQKYGYVPGPLLGGCLLVALVAALGLGRSRRSGFRSASLLFATTAFAVCFGTTAIAFFSWRYQLPQLVLLPPAFAIGVTALTRKRHDTVAPLSEQGCDGRTRPPSASTIAINRRKSGN